MKIEEGKFYKTRSGKKVGPASKSPWPAPNLPWSLSETTLYADDGVCGYGESPDNNVVSEWSEGPVRTETIERKVIVEGTYGIVRVDVHKNSRVIYVNPDDGYNASATELREAASTFLAIAEALESNK